MEARRVNYFEFFGGDYLRDTTRLVLSDHGVYLKLMIAYYSEEQPLPADYDSLYTIAVAVSETDRVSVKKVADKFFPVAEDGLRHHARIDEQIAKARKRIDAARQNGGKGGRPKKPKSNPSDNPRANPEDNPARNPPETHSGEALHAPHAKKEQEPKAPAAPSVDFRADLFRRWKALPDGGGGAFLNSLFRDHKPEQRVMEAVEYALGETRVDPKAFVVGVLRKSKQADDDMDELFRSAK